MDKQTFRYKMHKSNILDIILMNYSMSVEYILKTTETDLKNPEIAHILPTFYREIFCSFNSCKKLKTLNQFSSNEILNEPIWNNKIFTYKNKVLFFENWVKGQILYVKDLFDAQGNFKILDDFADAVITKTNWLCEYHILKNVFCKLKRQFDFSNAIYSNIKHNMIFNFQSGRHTVEGKRCKFFYDLLLQKKVQRPCYQNIMSKNFNISDRILWKNVYQTKLKFIDDPLVSEFNYKLLNNLLSNNLFLSKWKNTSPFCTACSDVI